MLFQLLLKWKWWHPVIFLPKEKKKWRRKTCSLNSWCSLLSFCHHGGRKTCEHACTYVCMCTLMHACMHARMHSETRGHTECNCSICSLWIFNRCALLNTIFIASVAFDQINLEKDLPSLLNILQTNGPHRAFYIPSCFNFHLSLKDLVSICLCSMVLFNLHRILNQDSNLSIFDRFLVNLKILSHYCIWQAKNLNFAVM